MPLSTLNLPRYQPVRSSFHSSFILHICTAHSVLFQQTAIKSQSRWRHGEWANKSSPWLSQIRRVSPCLPFYTHTRTHTCQYLPISWWEQDERTLWKQLFALLFSGGCCSPFFGAKRCSHTEKKCRSIWRFDLYVLGENIDLSNFLVLIALFMKNVNTGDFQH